MSVNLSARQLQDAIARNAQAENSGSPVGPPATFPTGTGTLGVPLSTSQGFTVPSGEVNLNLSSRQLKHPDLVADVARILRETGLPPQSLVLEITESVVMEEAESSIAVLHALKALGVRLAIDDFGTGFSSLSYLKSFPVDILKIDRKFVAGLHESAGDTAVVASMITLAHALSMTGGEKTQPHLHKRKKGKNPPVLPLSRSPLRITSSGKIPRSPACRAPGRGISRRRR